MYGHPVTRMPRAGARVTEIAVVGQLNLWPAPPRVEPPPPGFRLVERRRLERLTLIRYRARAPRKVTPASLALTNGIPANAVQLERAAP